MIYITKGFDKYMMEVIFIVSWTKGLTDVDEVNLNV